MCSASSYRLRDINHVLKKEKNALLDISRDTGRWRNYDPNQKSQVEITLPIWNLKKE